jgi:hypothetical protein
MQRLKEFELPTEFKLRQIIPVKAAANLNGISEDTYRRRFGHKIRKVSPRRDGVMLGDALPPELPAE